MVNEKRGKQEQDLEHASSDSSSTAVASSEGHDEKTQQQQKASPRWKRYLPFVKYNPPIPATKDSMDDAAEIPLAGANIFSILTFHWMQPMLSLGNKRPLLATDLWKLDSSREVEQLADRFLESFDRRRQEAAEWNDKISKGEYKPSYWQKHVSWPLKNKFGIQKKDGTYQAGLFMALNDVFGFKFWSAGFIKVIADSLQVTTPLVTKVIIQYGTSAYYSRRGVPGYEEQPIGVGVGAAVGLLCMLVCSSLLLHQVCLFAIASYGAHCVAVLYKINGSRCPLSWYSHRSSVSTKHGHVWQITRRNSKRQAGLSHLDRCISYRLCLWFCTHVMDFSVRVTVFNHRKANFGPQRATGDCHCYPDCANRPISIGRYWLHVGLHADPSLGNEVNVQDQRQDWEIHRPQS